MGGAYPFDLCIMLYNVTYCVLLSAANVRDLELPDLLPLPSSLPHTPSQVLPLLPLVPRPPVATATLQDRGTHQHTPAGLRGEHYLEEPTPTTRSTQRTHETLRQVSFH